MIHLNIIVTLLKQNITHLVIIFIHIQTYSADSDYYSWTQPTSKASCSYSLYPMISRSLTPVTTHHTIQTRRPSEGDIPIYFKTLLRLIIKKSHVNCSRYL